MYIIGILIGLYLQISVVFLCISLLIISIIIYLFSRKISYVIILIFVIIGNVYVKYIDVDYEKFYKNIPIESEIKAIVISNPAEKEYKRTYNIVISELNGIELGNKKKLIFNLKKSDSKSAVPKIR